MTLAVVFWMSQVQAGVNVGSTRVIYQSNQKEANLSISNSGEDGVPYLVQSWVSYFDRPNESADEFIITPPLFRLDAKNQNILRIIASNAQDLPSDKESLFLLNVKAIPAMSSEQRNQNLLQIALKTTIKLFYRPDGLKGSLSEAVENLQWTAVDGKLFVNNPTGFNIVISELRANNIILKNAPEVLKPRSKTNIQVPIKTNDTLQLTYINEYGSTVQSPPAAAH
jgi:fimbrial chaperone protein